jgi:hypothetical protein
MHFEHRLHFLEVLFPNRENHCQLDRELGGCQEKSPTPVENGVRVVSFGPGYTDFTIHDMGLFYYAHKANVCGRPIDQGFTDRERQVTVTTKCCKLRTDTYTVHFIKLFVWRFPTACTIHLIIPKFSHSKSMFRLHRQSILEYGVIV